MPGQPPNDPSVPRLAERVMVGCDRPIEWLAAGTPEAKAHLEGCPGCRIRLRLWRTNETSADPLNQDPMVATERVDAGEIGDVRARLEVLASTRVRMGTWIVDEPNALLRQIAPDLPSVDDALAADPMRLARIVDSMCDAVRALHETGTTHGNLRGTAWVDGDTVVLPHPSARPGAVADDLAALATTVTSWIETAQRSSAGARYVVGPLIGEGGMGEVLRAEDRLLQRAVALKRMRSDAVDSADRLRRFIAEGQITAQLQHPGIVPIHDRGQLPDGRLFYTMEEVQGVTLRTAIHMKEEWPTRRLVDAFARVCETVAYAHARGVVHRDLKPANVMLGDFGEVRVMDWGLASVPGAAEDAIKIPDSTDGTQTGAVLGTPTYLAPERVPPTLRPADRRSDVYALGAILYEILSDVRPYAEVRADLVLRAVAEGPPRPLLSLAPDAPDVLAKLVERCMARNPDDRPNDASEVAKAVRVWLDGLERSERSQETLASAIPFDVRAKDLRANALQLRDEAARELDAIPPWEAIEKKEHAWKLEDEASALEQQASVLDAQYEQGVRAAIELDPTNRAAQDALAHIYKARLLRAEARELHAEAARYTTLLETHDRGAHVPWLRGYGAVSLVTEPPGATVFVERYEQRAKRLVPVPSGTLGVTPLREASLPPGSYRLRLRFEGRDDVLYPVAIGRGEHWHGVPPDGHEPHPIWLPPTGSVEANECYVPAGWFGAGGDPDAMDSLPSRLVWVPAFVIGKFPVTRAEFVEFLNSRVDSGHIDDAAAHVGADRDGTPVYDFVGHRYELVLPGGAPGTPAVLVNWRSARAYARWMSQRSGHRWDLPHDLMWEKAARGVDRRSFPCGPYLDPAFACMAHSHSGVPSRVEVGSYLADVSPYGVQGMAGNARDLCLNDYARGGDSLAITRDDAASDAYRIIRGGSFTSVAHACRAATRFVMKPYEQSDVVGFRIARAIENVGVTTRTV